MTGVNNGANGANEADTELLLSELNSLREEVARLSTLLERQVSVGVDMNAEQSEGQAPGPPSTPEEHAERTHTHNRGPQGKQEQKSHPRIRTEHPHIVRIEDVHGGRPTIRGSGVSVHTIVEQTRIGRSPQEIVDDFDRVLTLAQVYDALSYYYEHLNEIEGYIAENKAILQKDPRTSVAGG